MLFMSQWYIYFLYICNGIWSEKSFSWNYIRLYRTREISDNCVAELDWISRFHKNNLTWNYLGYRCYICGDKRSFHCTDLCNSESETFSMRRKNYQVCVLYPLFEYCSSGSWNPGNILRITCKDMIILTFIYSCAYDSWLLLGILRNNQDKVQRWVRFYCVRYRLNNILQSFCYTGSSKKQYHFLTIKLIFFPQVS